MVGNTRLFVYKFLGHREQIIGRHIIVSENKIAHTVFYKRCIAEKESLFFATIAYEKVVILFPAFLHGCLKRLIFIGENKVLIP